MKRIMILMTALLASLLIGCSAETGSPEVALPVAEKVAVSSPTSTSPTTTKAPAITKAPAKTMDDLFLETIHEEGIFVNLTDQAIELAEATCDTFDAGASLRQVLNVAKENMPSGDAAFFIGASIGAYCPEYKYMINN